ITLAYAESLYRIEKGKSWQNQLNKGNRDEVLGKRFVGVKDSLVAAGFEKQKFVSLDWRTYRYIELTLKTDAEPLYIHDFYGIYTGYPFVFNAEANLNDDFIAKLLETGWRTARLCA